VAPRERVGADCVTVWRNRVHSFHLPVSITRKGEIIKYVIARLMQPQLRFCQVEFHSMVVPDKIIQLKVSGQLFYLISFL